ncbi:Endopolyphosphatase [Polychaeton citri CBS 116435]|uniref:Endopolyphosphatase n=1 Tax=Polychaeton citri CBS 116435 TaxID=1314669 RepID=A0A9P4QD78_9PEZI|nr:Endopolyphosphatase [Polychaeton citri CBS 116435]
MRGASYFCLGALQAASAVVAVPAAVVQVPLHQDNDVASSGDHVVDPVDGAAKRRPLNGKFLHITDFHPDRFYEVYSSTGEDAACHRGNGPAGIYGAEESDCDSPIALVNKTMEWIADNLKDEVDFVIWTGDSARHDNDDEHPRSISQVTELNKFMVHKMFEVWGKKNGDEDDDDPTNDFIIPVVPNFGNNDILPHNIMDAGPNEWTRRYASIWRQFIPEAQRHSFEQGGWFNVEVIPGKLAVFSLNTMYFFHSNAAVDGCAASSEPGYRQMEWLRIQLQFMRDRGAKAILIGHVPPARTEAKQQWDETCWQKYTLWVQQYRDVILTSLYGHMNYDHFFLQDFHDIRKDVLHGRMPYNLDGLSSSSEDDDSELHAELSTSYFVELRDQWSKLPKPPKMKKKKGNGGKGGKGGKGKKDKKQKYLEEIGGPFAENFAASFVSASVVPNLFPTIRVFEYNTTGVESIIMPNVESELLPSVNDDVETDKKKKKKKKKKPKKAKFTVPTGPSKSTPPGPAYSPQTLSLIRFTQYWANLTHINNDFSATSMPPGSEDLDSQKWKPGKHHGKKPHDKDHTPHPKEFEYQVLYDTQDDEVYNLKDLTMPSIVELARRIGDFKATSNANSEQEGEEARDLEQHRLGADAEEETTKHKKGKKGKKHASHKKRNEAWYTFIRRAFVYTIDPEEIDDQFGD